MTRNEDLLDRNLARLVRRWSDPPAPERTAQARQAFLEAATAPSRESPSQRRRGLIVTAAGLLICAAVYGSLFLAGNGSAGRSQDESKIKALIGDLAHAEVAKRDRAAAELQALGAKARPLLEEAVQGSSAEIRVRGQDVLDRLAAGGRNEKAELAAREAELENQRGFAKILSQRVTTLEDECSEKARKIVDLQRQLDSAMTLVAKQEADQAVFARQMEIHLAQIQELQKKLEEARKK
jgi:hypothetical protein